MASTDTLILRLMGWAKSKPQTSAIHGRRPDGSWRTYSWREYLQAVRETAKGLIALGLEPGECVGLVGNNSPEWVIAQFGIMAARGIPAPIYTTNTPEQVAYILGHSRCKIAICDNDEQLGKYTAARERDEVKIEKVVTLEAISGGDYTLASLRALGAQQDDAELEARLAAIEPRETCLLIYTSGTTGVPKAVQLCHEGLILIGESVKAVLPQTDYRVISYLPLCHVAEQVVTNVGMLAMGGEVFFCPDLKEVKEYLLYAHPRLFLGVPRVWEKFETAMRAKLALATGIKAKLAAWAMKTELEAFRREVAAGKRVGGLKRAIARKLVINKVKKALGFDQLMVAASGAAPINISTQDFFASLGIPIVEAYGMSETTGVATLTDWQFPVFGSVGKPLNGVEVRIADDDEILMRGANMTSGYLHMPEETKELYDDEGWLHTGDLGRFGSDGNLRITGRKKDLIITAGGKNVAPTEIEGHLAAMPGVGQAVVVGDRQPYLCALLALDAEGLPAFCTELGIATGSIAEVAGNPHVKSFFEKRIEKDVNSKLARYQTIKRIEIVPNEFSVDGNELTPTMKIRRNIVNEKYAHLIDKMFDGSGQPTRAQAV